MTCDNWLQAIDSLIAGATSLLPWIAVSWSFIVIRKILL